MKKLLALVLVLGLTASSFAVVLDASWIVSGSSASGALEVVAGDTITLTLHEGTSMDDGSANGVGFAVDQLANSVAGSIQTVFGTTLTNSEDAYASTVGTGFTTDISFSFDHSGAGGESDFDVLSFSFVVSSAAQLDDIILIECYRGSYLSGTGGGPGSIPDLSLTVVPEPMTMVLLGLGGLFLRRRK